MSEQAQSSGHEWAATSAGDKKFTVVCRCGAHLEADADAMIAAHVASVAQAAQPQEVPAEQREPLNAEVEHIIASAFGQLKCHCGDCVRVRAAEEYNRHLPQPASAAKPLAELLEAQRTPATHEAYRFIDSNPVTTAEMFWIITAPTKLRGSGE